MLKEQTQDELNDEPNRERDSTGAAEIEEYIRQLSNIMMGVFRSVKQDVQKKEGDSSEEALGLRYSEQTALIAICGCCTEQAAREGRDYAQGEGIRTSFVSNALDLAPSTITPLLDALEEKGLLERRRTKEDRRVVRVVPTSKGWKIAEYLRGKNQERFSEMLQWLGKEDCAQLLRIFKKIGSYYSGDSRTGPQ